MIENRNSIWENLHQTALKAPQSSGVFCSHKYEKPAKTLVSHKQKCSLVLKFSVRARDTPAASAKSCIVVIDVRAFILLV